jgi:DNA-binding NtrC family response regulator
VPPLRERKEDIPSLVYYFINKKMKQLKLPAAPELSAGAIDRLMTYHWPGNVRELENVVERELILNKGEPLTFGLLAGADEVTPPEILAGRANEPANLDKATALHIQRALQKANGIVHGPGGAAAILGINPSTLRSKMKKLGIPYGRKRG